MYLPYFLDENIALGIIGFVFLATLALLIWQKDKSVFGFVGIILVGVVSGYLVIKTNIMIGILLFILAGFCVAWMGRDEIVMGRKWIFSLFIVSCVASGIYYYIGNRIISESLIMVAAVAGSSVVASYSKRITRYPLPEE